MFFILVSCHDAFHISQAEYVAAYAPIAAANLIDDYPSHIAQFFTGDFRYRIRDFRASRPPARTYGLPWVSETQFV